MERSARMDTAVNRKIPASAENQTPVIRPLA